MPRDNDKRTSRGRGGRRGDGGNQRRVPDNIDSEWAENPVAIQFGEFSKMLDDKHDRYERIVKLSRDITIESKRIIFALHRISCDEDKPTIMEEARKRFNNVNKNLWRSLALELRGQDAFQYLRGYTAGLQEYIEALSFYHFLDHRKLIDWKTVQDELIFEFVNCKSKTESQDLEKSLGSVKIDAEKGEDGGEVKKDEKVVEPMIVLVPQTDYVLGLADLTGELMRNAINSVAAGDIDVCFSLLTFLQQIDDGFNRLDKTQTPNQVNRKLTTLKQSLRKVEMACYNINVRGSELPKNYLADVINNYSEEGYNREEESAYFDN